MTLLWHMRQMRKDIKDPSWMLALPLVHLLHGVCLPYEELAKDLDYDKPIPKWWGIAEIEDIVKKFKDCKTKLER